MVVNDNDGCLIPRVIVDDHREQARLLQGFRVGRGFSGRHKTIVGAGLLAKAVGLSPVMLAVPTSSRASSLLQGFWVDRGFSGRHKTFVGAGLPAMAVGQSL